MNLCFDGGVHQLSESVAPRASLDHKLHLDPVVLAQTPPMVVEAAILANLACIFLASSYQPYPIPCPKMVCLSQSSYMVAGDAANAKFVSFELPMLAGH
jgi:hypothetical protein